MSQVTVPNADAIAKDLTAALAGKLDQSKLDAAVNALRSTTEAYPANGSVVSFIFYLEFHVNITSGGGKSFYGKAGGAAVPGGGALFGHVYTDDVDRLYRNTASFQFTATPVYLSLIFFDGSSNVLGTFQSGGVSTVTGIGGGSGSWS